MLQTRRGHGYMFSTSPELETSAEQVTESTVPFKVRESPTLDSGRLRLDANAVPGHVSFSADFAGKTLPGTYTH